MNAHESSEDPERPELNSAGVPIPWDELEAQGLAALRTRAAKLWKVDCQCTSPIAHWMYVEDDVWVLHHHHTDPDCPTNKVLNAFNN